MPTECQVLRLNLLKSHGDLLQSNDTMPPAPALNDLIRALENSPPDSEGTAATASKAGDNSKVSSTASGLKLAQEKNNVDADTVDATSNKSEKQSEKRKASGDKKMKSKRSVTKKRQTVSDDDSSPMQLKKAKLPNTNKTPKMNMAEESTVITIEDFITTIDTALIEHRIDKKKAERLQECLESGSWAEVAYTLLCEQIPLKRKGKGYSCRVCQVPKKGHTCMYCHVCSTPEDKYKKDDEHVCINCPTCFEFGKKNKKLIQVKCEGHVCPHGHTEAQVQPKIASAKLPEKASSKLPEKLPSV